MSHKKHNISHSILSLTILSKLFFISLYCFYYEHLKYFPELRHPKFSSFLIVHLDFQLL